MLETSRVRRLVWMVSAVLVWGSSAVSAQDQLRQTNSETEVKSVQFRFQGRHFFDGDRLKEQMVTTAPGTLDRLRDRFSFLPFVSAGRYPLDPIELQRDMARLRRFYVRNGFLYPDIDYPATQFRSSTNSVRVIVTVNEGVPLRVTSREITTQDPLPEMLREDWERMKERALLKPGDRFTDFDQLQLESNVRSWLRDRGYGFADVSSDIRVDSVRSRVDLGLVAKAGPETRVDSIIVEGNESVTDNIVLRELPFKVGDRFSSSALSRGQRALFGLNLFRVALVDVPEQPVDSTVTVRIRLREAKPRFMDARIGYSREDGVTTGAGWRHRNFLGAARQFSVSGDLQTGLLSSPSADRESVNKYSGSISLGQPYMLVQNLSMTVGLTGSYVDDPNLDNRYRKASISPVFIYEILPFRTVSLQYTFSTAEPLSGTASLARLGIFSQDVSTLSLTMGWLNNYLTPRRGWIVRPVFEVAGTLISTDVSYVKAHIEALTYIPITRRTSVLLSVRAGRLHPRGPSRDQTDPDTEFRFDDVRFYAGGAATVRGWGLNAIGPRVARADSIIHKADGSYSVQRPRWESVGGLGKMSASVELIFPVPFLNSSWRGATFLDMGGVSGKLIRTPSGMAQFDANDQPLFEDGPFPTLDEIRFAAGAGLRLQTPVGAIRFDLAYKLNPGEDDLHDPASVVLYNNGLTGPPDAPFRRRFNFHLSIQRAF